MSRRSEPSQPTPTAQARTAKQHRTQRRSEYHGGEMMGTESIFRAALAAVVFLACTLPGAVRATAQGSQLLYQHGQRSSFLRGSTADGDVIAKLRSPPLAVIPAASEEESFRFSQHGLSLKTMSLEPSNSQDAPCLQDLRGTENSGSTGSASGKATGSASGAATGSHLAQQPAPHLAQQRLRLAQQPALHLAQQLALHLAQRRLHLAQQPAPIWRGNWPGTASLLKMKLNQACSKTKLEVKVYGKPGCHLVVGCLVWQLARKS